jgi:anion-transporting  ArsA/GET3 family ATPase
MTFILSFLGKGGTGKTTLGIASAKQLANNGSRVLLITQDPSPVFSLLLGVIPTETPQTIGANLDLVCLNSTSLIEKNWETVKELETKYLRSPTFKKVYGQELSILPGMDSILSLNALREYEKSKNYDAIVYDGTGDLEFLRMLGSPEVFSWYLRRFRQVLVDSELGKAISPFIQPITSVVLNVSWSSDNWSQESTKEASELLEDGKKLIADPQRLATYLVTTEDPLAIAKARFLWGSAQQVGVTVGGLLLNQGLITEEIKTEFAPLSITSIPSKIEQNWQPLIDALPNFKEANLAPKSLIIDRANRQVKVFLPGFDKKQVKLTQYDREITIEAGNQRRNIILPPPLEGQTIKGAKFQDQYLIISL